MADNTETTEQTQKTLFVTGAANGVGLALTTLAVKAGYKVVGTTDLGTVGAYRIRHAGGIPAYPDLTRESAVYSAIQMAKADVVIHAAAQDLNGIPQAKVNYDDKLAWLKASTEAIFAAAGRADVDRIVYLSAANAYADSHEPVSEDASLDTRSTLGSALHSAEEVVLDGGIPGYVLRIGYIMGTHNSSAVVTEMLRAGQSMMTNEHAVAWAHEDDVARAIMAIIELEEDASVANIYNIASEETITPTEFMRRFGNEYGIGEPGSLPDFMVQLRTHAVQRAIMGKSITLDTSKAQNELGWSPQGTVDGAIDKFLLMMRTEESAQMLPSPEPDDSSSQAIVKA
ncbi:MAG: NAD(P)-dependent oxidoreductase [Chloroflexota bacterium]